jgi:hypothetical protein
VNPPWLVIRQVYLFIGDKVRRLNSECHRDVKQRRQSTYVLASSPTVWDCQSLCLAFSAMGESHHAPFHRVGGACLNVRGARWNLDET